MANSGIRTHHLTRGDTLRNCIIQDINDAADRLRLMGKVRNREQIRRLN